MEDTKTRNLTKSAKGTVERPGKNVAQKRAVQRRRFVWFAAPQEASR